MDFVLNLNIFDGLKLILKARKKGIEEKLYQQWLIDRLFMTEENFETFQDYCDDIFNGVSVKSNHHSKGEILTKAKGIKELDLKQHNQEKEEGR